ncbi:hypothetical protein [Maribacter litoralis]|uniref:hypothetical protein n=1 Tax=Maribacter litoralis TaxID=2059726 RepID=UPI003F5CF272
MKTKMQFILYIVISLFYSVSVLAQNNNANSYPTEDPFQVFENTPKSPEVGSLGSYGNASASPYNGKGNVSVPLYSVNFEGMSIPLTLDYNTAGVQVMQDASWVGLNWSLSTSHGISRQIYGIDDLSNRVGGDYDQATTNGYIFNNLNLYLNEGAGRPYHTLDDIFNVHHSFALGVPEGRGSRAIDTQPDVFTLNALGQNYRFILKKKGATNIVQTYVFNNNNVIITLDLSTLAFTLIDEAGFTFTFASKEINTTFNTIQGDSGPQSSYEGAFDLIFASTNRRDSGVIMNWYLDKVTSPDDKVLNFVYDRGLHFTFPQYSFSYNGGDSKGWGNWTSGQRIAGGATSPHTVSTTVIENAYLTEINGDFGKIIFNLGNRLDLSTGNTINILSDNGFNSYVLNTANSTIRSCHGTNQNCGDSTPLLPKKLNGIIVENMLGTTVADITFEQSYFNAPQVSAIDRERFLRLKLDGVSINDKNYSFGYINPNNLSAKDTYGVDFWGFANGKENTNTSKVPRIGRFLTQSMILPNNSTAIGNDFVYVNGADRSADFRVGQTGLLNVVEYPTGGSTTFQYEGHEAVLVPTPQYEVTEYFPNNERYRWTNMVDESQFNLTYEYLKCAKDQDYNYFEKEYPVIQGNASQSTYSLNGVFEVLFPAVIEINTILKTQTGYSGMSYWGSYDLVVVENVESGQEYSLLKYIASTSTPDEVEKQVIKSVSVPPGRYKVARKSLPYLGADKPAWPAVSASQSVVTVNSFDQAEPDLSQFLESFKIGGARVRRIVNRNGDGSFISGKSYSYDKPNGFEGLSSSGILMDDLIFHSKTSGFYSYDPTYGDVMFNPYNSVGGNNSAQGSHIGYSYVRESQIDQFNNELGYIERTFQNQKNEYFTNSFELPYVYDVYSGNGDNFITFLGIKAEWFCSGLTLGNDCGGNVKTYSSSYGKAQIQNTIALGLPLKNGYGYLNGSVLNEKVYDNFGNLMQSQSNEYITMNGNIPPLYFSSFIPYPLIYSTNNTGSTLEVVSQVLMTSEGPWGTTHSTYVPYEFPLHHGLISKIASSESWTRYDNSNMFSKSSSTYNLDTHFLMSQTQTDSKGNENKMEYFYPYDQEVSSNYGMTDLIAENRFSSPVKTNSYLDEQLLYSSLINYNNSAETANKTRPWSVETVKGIENLTNPVREEYIYEKYNASGRVLQIRKIDGTSTAFIWGYNDQHMVAKIENATYDMIENLSLFGSDFNLGANGLSESQIESLRSGLPNSMVTTYNFNPLVGVQNITDPRGYKINYEYDINNRLKSVKDEEGNIVTDYEYKFQN